MPARSLRTRILVGSLLWMLGLVHVVSFVTNRLITRFPDYESRVAAHFIALAVVAAGFIIVGLLQVRRAFVPFERLREKLASLREGRERRIEGSYPAEVQPLVDDLNALLEHRERVVKRAVAKAGDLAHGLKTPLAVLHREAELARAAGNEEVAAAIAQNVDRMQRQIDYHLAHARAAASGAAPGASAPVAESVEMLGRVILRIHAARGIALNTHLDSGGSVRVEREDLEEMLGNLLDNAFKWGRSRVDVGVAATGGTIAILVDDDGPGIALEMRETVLQRGVRADEAAPGWGLGLAITAELAALYGGSLSLGVSPLGGVRARLELPAAA